MRLPFSVLTAGLLATAPMALIESGSRPVFAQAAAEDHKVEADSLLQQGIQQLNTGQYQAALQSFQQALEQFRATANPIGEGYALLGLGQVYKAVGQYQQALEQDQQALTIFTTESVREAFPKESRRFEGTTLNNIGSVYANLGQYEAALSNYQQALLIRKEIGDRAGEGTTLNNIGLVYDNLGQYETALSTFQQALLIRKEIGDRAGEGTTLNNIGSVYANLGQYEAALSNYQQALSISKEVGDRAGEGTTLNNIGSVYANLGQYEAALSNYQQALLIHQEVGNRPTEGTTLNNIGLVYDSLGQYETALSTFQQALSISKEVGDRAGEGTTLNNIGGVYFKLGQYETALSTFQQALSIHQEVGNRPTEGTTLNNIGLVYDSLGQYETALSNYQQALSIHQEVGNRPMEGTTLNNIGSVYVNLGQYKEALSYLQQSLAIIQEIGDGGSEGTIFNNIGLLLKEQEQPELAIVFYKQSVNAYELVRGNIRGLSSESQQAYTDKVSDTYRQLADLLLQNDRVLEAQRVLDLLKVQELEDYLQNVRGNSDTRTGVEVLRPEQEILTRYEALQTTAIQLGQELAALNQKKTNSSLTPAEEQRRQELSKLQEELNQQFNNFVNSSDITALIEQLTPRVLRQTVDLADLAGLQDNLQTLDAALFYPLILEDRIELVITTANTPPLRRTVKVNRTTLNETIVEFRRALQNPNLDAKVPAQKLYEWLIAPIAADLQQANVKTIIYAPDGQLRYIPLAALYNADQQQWLSQQYRVNNITAKSLTEFDTRPQTAPRVLAAAFADETITYPVPVGAANINYSGLPFAGKEVAGLSTLMPNTTALVDHAFSLDAVVPEMARFNIIHFATHAAFVTGDPTESFILFGNGDRPTLRDVENWTLANVDLVVLSACETGLGGQYGNGEEILGLGYQFQAKGARAVMASLWKVNDGGTQVLMNAFYNALENGMTKAEAIRQAQIALITGNLTAVGDPRGSVVAVSTETGLPAEVSNNLNHPHYWAPFILIGNGL